MIIFYLISLAICVIWVHMLVYLNYTMRCLPVLKRQIKPINYDDAELPMVSIIVPACNEDGHLEQSLLSRLNQDYPRFELIVINDRSTDGTKEIIDRIAAIDDRLITINITKLPNYQMAGLVRCMRYIKASSWQKGSGICSVMLILRLSQKCYDQPLIIYKASRFNT